MTSDGTPDLMRSGATPSTEDGPEVERIKAILEARMLGGQQPATHIGRFVVLERVGAGGMGVVYAAFDPQLDRKVAIKLLFEGETDERERARLLGEAKAMAKLAHPNVVGVYEVGEHRGRVFIAMEYVRGRTFRSWVAERPRSWRETLAMCIQAGRGLAAAHAAGIVHRDFKPDNVLISESPLGVGEDERARVLDFGLARRSGPTDELSDPGPQAGASAASDHSLTKLTRTGALVGTPAYMAPEQIRGEVADTSADQFAFCVATWEALAGERPFAGDTMPRLFDHVTRGELREPPRGRMPGWAAATLRRGLAPKPDQRHPSVHALLAALERGAAGRRRASFGAGAAVVVVAGLGVWGGWRLELERRRAQCESDAQSITEVWNDDAKSRLRDALLATGVTYAESTIEHALPFIDEYAEAWRHDYAELCVATEVERTRSEVLWAASRSCLDERRGELGARLDVLTREADATAVQRSVAAAAGLPRLEDCRDDARLARTWALPADAPLRDALWRAESLDAAGKHADARDAALAVAEAAEAAGVASIRPSALRLAGVAAAHAGDNALAKTTLEEAFNLFVVSDDDEGSRIAAIELARLLAPIGEHDDAIGWGRIAQSLQLRSGTDDDLEAAQLDEALATAYFYRDGRESLGADVDAESREHLRHALEIRETLQGPDHPEIAATLVQLIEVETSAAYIACPAGCYGALEPLARRAVAISEKSLGPDHPDLARSLHAVGGVLVNLGRYEEAKPYLERAAAILDSSAPDHPDMITVLNYLGTAYHNTGDLDAAEQAYERAIAAAERASTDHWYLPKTLCDLGNVHVAKGQGARARPLYERGLMLGRAGFSADSFPLVYCGAFSANLHSLDGEHEKAQELYLEVLDMTTRWRHELHRSSYLDLYGMSRARAGAHAEARDAFAQSLAIQLRHLGANWPGQAATLVNLARAELHTDGPARARARAERALELAQTNTGLPLIWYVMDEHANTSQMLGTGVIPSAQFELALAAWASGDRAAAQDFATQARAGLQAAGVGFDRRLAEVERWLTAHAGSRDSP